MLITTVQFLLTQQLLFRKSLEISLSISLITTRGFSSGFPSYSLNFSSWLWRSWWWWTGYQIDQIQWEARCIRTHLTLWIIERRGWGWLETLLSITLFILNNRPPTPLTAIHLRPHFTSLMLQETMYVHIFLKISLFSILTQIKQTIGIQLLCNKLILFGIF